LTRRNIDVISVISLAGGHVRGYSRLEKETQAMSQPQAKLTRRTLFAGAGTAGAIAAAATVVPHLVQQEQAAPADLKPAPEKGGGYQLTDHVKRYYQTTRT
jgi:hypothetical protein